jgi:hypothetical protein
MNTDGAKRAQVDGVLAWASSRLSWEAQLEDLRATAAASPHWPVGAVQNADLRRDAPIRPKDHNLRTWGGRRVRRAWGRLRWAR